MKNTDNTIKPQSTLHILNGFTLKIIALLIMTIDHIGAVFAYDSSYNPILSEDTCYILRSIGRLSFPIFCFMIIEGFFYTRNVTRYLFRLSIFAFVSQIPFSLAFRNKIFDFGHLNVFFTLSLGLALVTFIDHMTAKSATSHEPASKYFGYIFVALFSSLYLADALGFDYGEYGILLILIFYFFRMPEEALSNDKLLFKYIGIQVFLTFIITYVYSSGIQIYCLISFVFILLYNRKKGPSMKYFFYAYYPVHLLILYGIYMLL